MILDFIRGLTTEQRAEIYQQIQNIRADVQCDEGVDLSDSEQRALIEDICIDYGLYADLDD